MYSWEMYQFISFEELILEFEKLVYENCIRLRFIIIKKRVTEWDNSIFL